MGTAKGSDSGDETRLDPRDFERAMGTLAWPSRYFRVGLEGAERLPEGGALLVGNHGPMGMDAPLLLHALFRQTGRAARGLAEPALFRDPWRARLLRAAGVVRGSGDVAQTLLHEGQWVVTYPGGARERVKGPDTRYRLLWEGRTAFVRAALRADVPIVPVACLGIESIFVQLLDQRQVQATPVGHALSMMGTKKPLPFYFGLGPMPLPRRVRFVIGKPIQLPFAASAARDASAVAVCKRYVQRSLQTLIAHEPEPAQHVSH